MSRKKPARAAALPKTRKLIGYCRVSTEQQATDGASLEAQKAQLTAYASAFGYELVGFEVDAGASAKSLDRPALKSALARLEAGEADGLLVVKLDRLSRRLRDMVELVDTYFQSRFSLLSVNESIDTGTPTGRLILNVLASVAEWEREAAAERTRAVMDHMKAQGKFTGGWPPFGWRLDEDGNLVADEYEQMIIAEAKRFKAAGRSLRGVAAALPVNPNTGKPYSASQIQRML